MTWTTDERDDRDQWHNARRVLLANLLDVDEPGLDGMIVEARRDIADLIDRVDRIIADRSSQ